MFRGDLLKRIYIGLHTNLTTYLTSLFLYNFARVLPHAVLTVILLDKGMTIGKIAFIQSWFMVAALIFEFPSGVLTDAWSEKYMYLGSLILLASSYFLIMLSSEFWVLCVAWFVYGLSSASISGSLETYFLRRYANNGEMIKKFNVKYNNINLYSSLIGGGIGSFIYTFVGNSLYLVSIILLAVSFFVVGIFFKADRTSNVDQEKSNKTRFREIFGQLLSIKDKALFLNVFLFAIFQIITQLFFQFWQVMFLEAHLSVKTFGIFYIAFQVIAIFSNYLFNKMNYHSSKMLLIIMMSILIVNGLVIKGHAVIFLLSIFLFLIPFNIYNNQLVFEIQKLAPIDVVSSVTSFAETLSSISSMFFLWMIGFLNNTQQFSIIAIEAVVLFALLSLCLLYFY